MFLLSPLFKDLDSLYLFAPLSQSVHFETTKKNVSGERERDAVQLVVIFTTAGDSAASDAAGVTKPAGPCFSTEPPEPRAVCGVTCPTPSA